MNNYDRILTYAKNNCGYITTKEAMALGISRVYLSNLVSNNELERVGSGTYKLPEYPFDYFYIISNCSKNMCFSHLSALYLHEMTDRVPLIYEITVPYNYSGNLLNMESVSIKYVSHKIFNLGLMDIKTINGLPVKCYNLERTICDLIKDKNKIDTEAYVKALKDYASYKKKNLLNLTKYAKELGIEKEVIEIMEVLL